jgi:hypothetical protein
VLKHRRNLELEKELSTVLSNVLLRFIRIERCFTCKGAFLHHINELQHMCPRFHGLALTFLV